MTSPSSPILPPPHRETPKIKKLNFTFPRMASVKIESYSPINQLGIYSSQQEEITRRRKLQKARPVEVPKIKVTPPSGEDKEKGVWRTVREVLGMRKKGEGVLKEVNVLGKEDEEVEEVLVKKENDKSSGLARFNGTLWYV
jgi:hypothetical protein